MKKNVNNLAIIHNERYEDADRFEVDLVNSHEMKIHFEKAKKLGDDTRLEAFEARDLAYEIPAKDVVLVRAELYYNLLWPGLVKKFEKKIPADVMAPKLIATAENSL